MREPLAAVIGIRVTASTYKRYIDLPLSRKREINNIMRSMLEKLIDQQQEQQQQPQEYRVVVEHKTVYTEDERLKIIERLEKCRAELASVKERNIELEEELQAKTKQLEELQKRVDQKQLEELQKQIALLKAEISNISELALSLLYCLQNGDCDISQVRATALLRLKLRSLPEPPKLYALLKVRS